MFMDMPILLLSHFFLTLLIICGVKSDSSFDITYYYLEAGKLLKTDKWEEIINKQLYQNISNFVVYFKYIIFLDSLALTSE